MTGDYSISNQKLTRHIVEIIAINKKISRPNLVKILEPLGYKSQETISGLLENLEADQTIESHYDGYRKWFYIYGTKYVKTENDEKRSRLVSKLRNTIEQIEEKDIDAVEEHLKDLFSDLEECTKILQNRLNLISNYEQLPIGDAFMEEISEFKQYNYNEIKLRVKRATKINTDLKKLFQRKGLIIDNIIKDKDNSKKPSLCLELIDISQEIKMRINELREITQELRNLKFVYQKELFNKVLDLLDSKKPRPTEAVQVLETYREMHDFLHDSTEKFNAEIERSSLKDSDKQEIKNLREIIEFRNLRINESLLKLINKYNNQINFIMKNDIVRELVRTKQFTEGEAYQMLLYMEFNEGRIADLDDEKVIRLDKLHEILRLKNN